VSVQGLLSDVQRKNCEAIALEFDTSPRTLQRFLESIKWDEQQLRDRCQEIVARDHAHPEAIGLIDESGIGKSGRNTAGVARQYNGGHRREAVGRGKIENCVVGVHLGYSAPGFQTILDSRFYLPEHWADDKARRKKVASLTMPRAINLTGLSFLLCSRIRQSLDQDNIGRLTVEQVRRSINTWLQHRDQPEEKLQRELVLRQL